MNNQEQPERGSVYAVGDIHGAAGKLAAAIEYLRATLRPCDRVVFLGDYIDRGPSSKRVVEMLLSFRDDRPETVFLRGNHEELLLNSLRPGVVEAALANRLRPDRNGNDACLWSRGGGYGTLVSYGLNWCTFREGFPAAHREFLNQLEFIHQEGRFTFVHAGLLPPELLRSNRTDRDVRLWIRHEFIRSLSDFGTIVVFGHTPQWHGQPLIMHNKIGIDTAAAYGKKLTVLKVDPFFEGEFSPDSVEYVQF